MLNDGLELGLPLGSALKEGELEAKTVGALDGLSVGPEVGSEEG